MNLHKVLRILSSSKSNYYKKGNNKCVGLTYVLVSIFSCKSTILKIHFHIILVVCHNLSICHYYINLKDAVVSSKNQLAHIFWSVTVTKQCLPSTYYIPSTLPAYNYLILKRALKGKYYYSTNFTDKQSEAFKGQITAQNDTFWKIRTQNWKIWCPCSSLQLYCIYTPIMST